MDGSRAVNNQVEGRPLGKIIMALALIAALFSFVVLPGNVAAADDGALSGDMLTIILVIVVVAIVAIAILVLKGSKKAKSSASPATKAAASPAIKADGPVEEPGHNEGGKCSKCGAPMLEAWNVCPKCAGRILLGEITK